MSLVIQSSITKCSKLKCYSQHSLLKIVMSKWEFSQNGTFTLIINHSSLKNCFLRMQKNQSNNLKPLQRILFLYHPMSPEWNSCQSLQNQLWSSGTETNLWQFAPGKKADSVEWCYPAFNNDWRFSQLQINFEAIKKNPLPREFPHINLG